MAESVLFPDPPPDSGRLPSPEQMLSPAAPPSRGRAPLEDPPEERFALPSPTRINGSELPEPAEALLGAAESLPARQSWPSLEPLPRSVAPPDKKITFDIKNFGQLEAYYHQIIRKDDFLILVNDKRFVGTRYIPQHSDVPLGAHIDGTDRIFLLRTSGIRFELDEKEICILVIENEASHSGYLRDGIMSGLNMEVQHDGETMHHIAGSDPSGEEPGEEGAEEPQGF